MARRFVFVPICGPSVPTNWMQLPHIKAWGFLNDDADPQLTAIHTESDDTKCIQLFEPCSVFRAEAAAAIDVAENSTELPDEVCIALAKFALMPVSRSNSND